MKPNKPTKPNKQTQVRLPLGYGGAGKWHVPCKRIKIDDRTYALRLGHPVMLGTATDIERETGIPRKMVPKLAAAGFFDDVKPSPTYRLYYYADVLEFLEKTKAPNFWNSVRREAYLRGITMAELEQLKQSPP